MSIRCCVIFPYASIDEQVKAKLWQILAASLDPAIGLHDSTAKPVLVVNKDTIERGLYKQFVSFVEASRRPHVLEGVDVIRVWSVDTCQMWLCGFGKIIDDKDDRGADDSTTSVLQIPGDLKHIRDFDYFQGQMAALGRIVETGLYDLAIGDFEVEHQRAKQLIDIYGTYPLLFNWFPRVGMKLRDQLKIKRPRSEFFAVSVKFLRETLRRRKFAYEQTMAFLIYALAEEKPNWKVGKLDIGTVADYGETRGFREATDQIERTERMLKVLWREMTGGDGFDITMYETLDRRSTAIREAAMVYLENVLRAREGEVSVQ